MHSLDFRVHVTHRNHHPPTFAKPEYRFYAPVTLPVGAQVGKMEVCDFNLKMAHQYSDFRHLSESHYVALSQQAITRDQC